MSAIKTVIFDMGGVIVGLDFPGGYQSLARASPFEAVEIAERMRSTDLVVRFESGQIDVQEFHYGLAEVLRLHVSLARFTDMWCDFMLPHAIVPVEWVEALRRQYRLILLSNTNEIHFDLVRRQCPHLGYFDDFILSYEVGSRKPTDDIYRQAIERSGCRPEECFFTDDVMRHVDGARRNGLDAEQFLDPAKLKSDLARRGVLVC